MCGEKIEKAERLEKKKGSPPRVRGKVKEVEQMKAYSRITPACAGKRSLPPVRLPERRDHPRVCGEKCSASWTVNLRQRITPACAGKSCNGGDCWRCLRDHPRVCGEKEHRDESYGFLLGSPPRVRGKGQAQSVATYPPRITPACAGKS